MYHRGHWIVGTFYGEGPPRLKLVGMVRYRTRAITEWMLCHEHAGPRDRSSDTNPGAPVMTRQELAKALGGTRNGPWTNIAGPGHKASDRSLGFRFDPKAPDGFWVHSLAGDDPVLCQKHVLALLESAVLNVEPEAAHDEQVAWRITRARALWGEGQHPKGRIVEQYLTMTTRACPRHVGAL